MREVLPGPAEARWRFSECIKKACQLAELSLYPRHPHTGSRDEPNKKSGPKTRSFHLRSSPGPRTVRVTAPTVTELLRKIEDIVSPTVTGMGFELVRVSMSRGGGTLQIMIEPADGRPMDVEACAIISRALSAVLDVEDPMPGAYTLEVSSPGIDRPLTREKDYTRWTGHLARMETALPIDGRRRFKGTL